MILEKSTKLSSEKVMSRLVLMLMGLFITTACGLLEMTSSISATREAEATTMYATVSAMDTVQADILKIKKTELSSEIGIAPSTLDGLTWTTRWLSNPTCQPPCWENIEPGVTTIDEAAKIVIQIPSFDITWLPSMAGMGKGYKVLSWKMDHTGHGSIGTERWEEIVPSIHLELDGEQKLFLGEIVSVYGNPTNVTMRPCFEDVKGVLDCSLYIVFKEKGMALYKQQNSKRADIQADTTISSIFFYPIEDIGAKVIRENIVWTGYGQYTFGDQ